jgi:FixJ family two-component response regulator
MNPEQKVYIVDDDEAYRDSVRELVNSVGLETQTFGAASEFLDAFHADMAGCLVLDVRMIRMSGIALQARLSAMESHLPIVFISGHGDIEMAVGAIKSGAVDFVQKPYREQHLLDAIDEALRRDRLSREGLAGSTTTGPTAAMGQKLAALTAREMEVMSLALKGVPNKLIAKQLSLSHRTVEHHRSRLLEKLGVASIVDLMRVMNEPLEPRASHTV